MSTPIYLRDLKDSLREIEEDMIRKQRPDLINDLEEGNDIVIGHHLNSKDFELA